MDRTARGKFRARITIDGERKTLDEYDDERSALNVLEAAKELLASRGHASSRRSMTLQVFAPQVLDKREMTGEVKDVVIERSRYDCHIKDDPIARLPIKSIRRKHCQAFIDRLIVKPKLKPAKGGAFEPSTEALNRQTVQNIVSVLSIVLSAAARDGLIEVNPLRDCEIPRSKNRKPPPVALTREELVRLFNVMRRQDVVWFYLLSFMLGTGLRQSDLVRVKLDDLHLQGVAGHECTCESPMAVDHILLRQSKTGEWIQQPLVATALVARQWIEVLPKFCPPSRNVHRLLFPKRSGSARSAKKLLRSERWRQWLTDASVPLQRHGRQISPYALRRTSGTALLNGLWGAEMDLEVVSRHLGHTETRTTERHYARVGSAKQERAAVAVNAGFVSSELAAELLGPDTAAAVATATDAANLPSAATRVVPSFPIVVREKRAVEALGIEDTCFPSVSRKLQTAGPEKAVEEIALEALLAIRDGSDGEAVAILGRALAGGVLEEFGGRLALDVLDGASVEKVVRLAELVLGLTSARARASIGKVGAR